jgi:hypothetical protein
MFPGGKLHILKIRLPEGDLVLTTPPHVKTKEIWYLKIGAPKFANIDEPRNRTGPNHAPIARVGFEH